MPFFFGDEPSNYGESTAVNCMITKGDHPISIQWSLNGEPITNNNDGIVIVKMSTKLSSLSIDSINHKHRGIYKCIASNLAGKSEVSDILNVNGTKQII